MKPDSDVPGPGQERHISLPDSHAGVEYELARIVKFIQEGRKDALVIETARKVVELGLGTARQLGRKISHATHPLIALEALHAWCRENFEYINDPVDVELIQTASRQLRRLDFPSEFGNGMWTPIRKAMALQAKKKGDVLVLPKPKMVEDSDEAVIVSLSLAAAVGVSPLKLYLGGKQKTVHYVWGAAWADGKLRDFDILHAKFGERHPSIELLDVKDVPLNS